MDEKKDKMLQDGVSRRSVLGVGSVALAAAAFASLSASAQEKVSGSLIEAAYAMNQGTFRMVS